MFVRLCYGKRQFAFRNVTAEQQHHGPLHRVLQLADIPRPRVFDQHVHRLGGKSLHILSVPLAENLEEVLRQKGDVLAPLLKGRNLYADDVEPIIQILAKAPGRDLIQQVAVRSRHDAHIHLEGGVASHALDLPLLDGPQELDLHEQGNFADFIQKQRAAVRLQKTPVPALVRARESAFLVPEQFGFQKAFGQGRTVHRHPRAVLALALVMDGPRHQLLARPGLAVDQHRRLRRGHSVDHLQHPPDGGAVSHDALHWNGRPRCVPTF